MAGHVREGNFGGAGAPPKFIPRQDGGASRRQKHLEFNIVKSLGMSERERHGSLRSPRR